MLDVGIKETTSTTGPGTVTLSAVSNFVRVSQAFGVGDLVAYCLTSGNGDKEWGVGTAGSGNTLSRDFIDATLVGSTFTRSGATAISLTGTSTLIVTEHGDAPAISRPTLSVPFMTQYLSPFLATNNAGSTLVMVADRLYAIPFITPAYTDELTGIALVVTTVATGTAYVGIAESARSAGGYRPGRLLGQAQIDTSTSGIKSDTVNYVPRLRTGHLYWALITCTAAPTVRGITYQAATPMMGIGTDGINTWNMLYKTQAGPIPSDLSADAFSAVTAGSTIPNILFTT
jgi:hypothetical protein